MLKYLTCTKSVLNSILLFAGISSIPKLFFFRISRFQLDYLYQETTNYALNLIGRFSIISTKPVTVCLKHYFNSLSFKLTVRTFNY